MNQETLAAKRTYSDGKFLQFPGNESFVRRNFHIESREVDVPACNQRVQKGYAVFVRDIEDIGVEEFQNDDAQFFIALVTSAAAARFFCSNLSS